MVKAMAGMVAALFAGPALAHSGPHLHPHDGGGWQVVLTALVVLGLSAGIALARTRARG